MEGVSIVETKVLEALINKIETLQEVVVTALAELKDTKKPYLSINEVSEITGFSVVWVVNNKQDIGYTSIGRSIRFKRKDVETYMQRDFLKTKRGKYK